MARETGELKEVPEGTLQESPGIAWKNGRRQGGLGSVRLRKRGWNGSSGSGFRFQFGSSAKRFFFLWHLCFPSQFNRKGRFRFQFRFLENGSGGSAFGFGKNGSDGSISRFRFGS